MTEAFLSNVQDAVGLVVLACFLFMSLHGSDGGEQFVHVLMVAHASRFPSQCAAPSPSC